MLIKRPSDFECEMRECLSMSETVDLLGFSADKSFLGLIKNSPKKIKYPLSSTSLGKYALLMSKENGQIRNQYLK